MCFGDFPWALVVREVDGRSLFALMVGGWVVIWWRWLVCRVLRVCGIHFIAWNGWEGTGSNSMTYSNRFGRKQYTGNGYQHDFIFPRRRQASA